MLGARGLTARCISGTLYNSYGQLAPAQACFGRLWLWLHIADAEHVDLRGTKHVVTAIAKLLPRHQRQLKCASTCASSVSQWHLRSRHIKVMYSYIVPSRARKTDVILSYLVTATTF